MAGTNSGGLDGLSDMFFIDIFVLTSWDLRNRVASRALKCRARNLSGVQLCRLNYEHEFATSFGEVSVIRPVFL